MRPAITDDVFVDIEAGIGNVVAQFALTTAVGSCLGYEVRGERAYLVAVALRIMYRVLFSSTTLLW